MQKRYKPLMSAVMVLMSALWMIAGVASADNHLPSDCDTARDRAKSKYGAVRHYFDTFNLCMTRADGDLAQCQQALNDQQGALGDFIFAQRVAQDVCGREGLSGDMAR
ncbi:MAG: hypothetical protein L7S53_01645 [Luminiphilus sp.]|nr:hypothetical protein [Luminiphilus sp.]